MTHAVAIRLLTTLADMTDNERVVTTGRGVVLLRLSPDFALQFASACEHAAKALAGLPEVEEEP